MRIHLEDLARVGYVSGAATNTGVISLFNSIPGPNFLIVHYAFATMSTPNGLDYTGLATLTAPLGSIVAIPVPIIAGHQVPQGNLYYADTPNPPAADSYICSATFGAPPAAMRVPLAILQPGTGLAVISSNQGQAQQVTFFYQVVKPERLYRAYDLYTQDDS